MDTGSRSGGAAQALRRCDALRWRKRDSNPKSHHRKSSVRKHATVELHQGRDAKPKGTEGSNAVSSSAGSEFEPEADIFCTMSQGREPNTTGRTRSLKPATRKIAGSSSPAYRSPPFVSSG